jgi:tetratricopeptide (TPR) repeat protein
MAKGNSSYQWRLVAAAAGVSALLGVLSALLAIGYFKQRELQRAAQTESRLAQKAANEARDAANRGNRARDEAEELVGFILEDLSEELDLIGRSDLLAAAAQKAVAYFESLPPELVTRESRDHQATMLLTLAQGHYVQGDLDTAVSVMDRAIALRRELAAGEDPEGEFTFVLGRELGELALFQSARDDFDDARTSLREALELFSDPPPLAIRDGQWDFGMSAAHFGLGEVERLQGKYEGALAAYAEAETFLTRALHKQPDHVTWLKKLMNLHNNCGVARMYLGEFKQAETNYLRGVATARALVRLEPANRRWEKELGTGLMNVGTCLDEQEDYARAEPFIREGLQIRRGLVSWDPKNARHVRSLAHAWHNLSSLQFSTGQPANALASCREAMAAYRRLLTLDPGNRRWIDDMQQSAAKYRDRLATAGLKSEALQLIEEAVAFAERLRSGDPRGDAWDDLLAGFYDDIQALGGSVQTAAILESARQSLAARAERLDLNPLDPSAVYEWALGCIRFGEFHHEAGLAAAGLVCIQLGRLALRDLVPAGFKDRELILEEAERLAMAAALASGRMSSPLTLVPAGAVWRYWDRATVSVADWTRPEFDDAAWAEGAAPIGYGEADLATVIEYGEEARSKHLTAWFRHGFKVDDPDHVESVTFHLRRDDGAVVYLNGREIIRDSLPLGDIGPATVADMAANEAERVYHISRFAGSQLPLRAGRNLVAVEIHQNEPQSSDLVLDLEILGNAEELDPQLNLDFEEAGQILGEALPKTVKGRWPL